MFTDLQGSAAKVGGRIGATSVKGEAEARL